MLSPLWPAEQVAGAPVAQHIGLQFVISSRCPGIPVSTLVAVGLVTGHKATLGVAAAQHAVPINALAGTLMPLTVVGSLSSGT